MKHVVLVLLSVPLLVQASSLELYYDFKDAMGSGSIQDSAVAMRPEDLNPGDIGVYLLDDAGSVLATDTGVITFIDVLGKKMGATYLSAPVTDMKLWDGELLATARDGYAYALDLQGQVQSKIRFQYNINSVHPSKITVTGKTAVLSPDSTVYLAK